MSFLSCSDCSEGDLRGSVSGGQFKIFCCRGRGGTSVLYMKS